MPIYEYKCSSCGTVFEKLQKFSDPPLNICECGKVGTVERLLSPPAFHLKGGGWYKDGYGGSAPAKNGGSETKGSESKGSESKSTETKSSESKSSDSKTESKSAASTSSTTTSSISDSK